PDGPGFAYKTAPVGMLRDGSVATYGRSYDVDQLSPGGVTSYGMIVARRRPDSSRPPAPFQRIFHGRFYDVWRKLGGSQVVAHIPAGYGLEPAGRVRCGDLRKAISAAGPGVSVAYVERP